MKQHIKTFAVIILITLVVSTLCDMLNAVDCFLPTLSGVTIAALIKPLVLFGLTTYFIKRYKATVKPIQIGCAALIGAIIIELPLHIIHFRDTLVSLPDMIISALAILAALSSGDFQSAGIIAFLLLVTIIIETRTASGAQRSIEELIKLTPNTAHQVIDGVEQDVQVTAYMEEHTVFAGDAVAGINIRFHGNERGVDQVDRGISG